MTAPDQERVHVPTGGPDTPAAQPARATARPSSGVGLGGHLIGHTIMTGGFLTMGAIGLGIGGPVAVIAAIVGGVGALFFGARAATRRRRDSTRGTATARTSRGGGGILGRLPGFGGRNGSAGTPRRHGTGSKGYRAALPGLGRNGRSGGSAAGGGRGLLSRLTGRGGASGSSRLPGADRGSGTHRGGLGAGLRSKLPGLGGRGRSGGGSGSGAGGSSADGKGRLGRLASGVRSKLPGLGRGGRGSPGGSGSGRGSPGGSGGGRGSSGGSGGGSHGSGKGFFARARDKGSTLIGWVKRQHAKNKADGSEDGGRRWPWGRKNEGSDEEVSPEIDWDGPDGTAPDDSPASGGKADNVPGGQIPGGDRGDRMPSMRRAVAPSRAAATGASRSSSGGAIQSAVEDLRRTIMSADTTHADTRQPFMADLAAATDELAQLWAAVSERVGGGWNDAHARDAFDTASKQTAGIGDAVRAAASNWARQHSDQMDHLANPNGSGENGRLGFDVGRRD